MNLSENKTEPLWVERYRPTTIEDCILPESIKNNFQKIVDQGEIFNMLLTGTAGLGKTTVARALCDTLKLNYIIINGSEESGIDVLRNKIRKFASSVSLTETKYKVVILDEADYLNATSVQPALRGFIEEFSKSCRFILTCNFKNRLIAPLHSRCTTYEFNTTKKELASLASQFMVRLKKILENENINYDEKALAELIILFAPDWRRVLNECQRYSLSGNIDSGILAVDNNVSVKELVNYLKNKDFRKMRSWVVNHMDLEATVIFRRIYDNLSEYIKPQSIPQVILILAEYQYKSAFVADQEINMVACLTEIMAETQWN